jgi:hypothetical protein
LIALAIFGVRYYSNAQPAPPVTAQQTTPSRPQQTASEDRDQESNICLGTNTSTYEMDGQRYALPFDIINDQAIVEGDIVLGQAADGGSAPVVPDYVRGEAKRWENNVVPYVIDPSVTASDRAVIQQAITAWQRATHVRFRQQFGARDWQRETSVKFSGERAQCTTNSVGVKERLSGSAGEADNVNVVEVAGCGQSWGRIAHQIGHVLGLNHEHTRGDRDAYIKVLWGNIDRPRQFCRALWDQRALADSSYDFDSIMHAAPDQGAKRASGCERVSFDGREDCLSFLPDHDRLAQQRQALNAAIRPGQRDHLSEADIARVNALYPTSPSTSVSTTAQPCVRNVTTSIKVGDRVQTTTKTEPCSPRVFRPVARSVSARPFCCRNACRDDAACPVSRVGWSRPARWCSNGWCRRPPTRLCNGWIDDGWDRPVFDDADEPW